MIKFLDLAAQYRAIQPEVDAAIREVIESAAFIGGPAVHGFESEFAAYLDADHCVGVANGTDALEIILAALQLPRGSEVIVPANSFIASSEAVTTAGLRVVFADVDAQTYTLDPQDVLRRITPRTSAVIAVHLYGHPCDMPALLELAARHDLKVVEDAAQAHGATLGGRRVGTLGHAAAFSFYPGKNLGAYGDAGAITTNDAALANRCRMLANHGRIAKYDHQFEGRNSRLDGIQAAVLRVKLAHLESWIEQRNRIAAAYTRALEGVGDLVLPHVASGVRHAFHLYVVRTRQRDALREHLSACGIETGIHYPIALPQLAAYAALEQGGEPTFANSAASTLLSLPLGEHLSDEDVREVVDAIRGFFTASRAARRPAAAQLG